MKAKAFLLLILATVLGTCTAAVKEPVRVPAPEGVLPVIVTEMTVGNAGNAFSDFDRVDLAFKAVAKERKWPLKIAADRLASGVPEYQTELRVSLQRVRQDIPGEYVYRAWTTLWVDGKKTDFSVITYSYSYRMGQNMDDVMEKTFLGGARATADKIEPLLFPDLNKKK